MMPYFRASKSSTSWRSGTLIAPSLPSAESANAAGAASGRTVAMARPVFSSSSVTLFPARLATQTRSPSALLDSPAGNAHVNGSRGVRTVAVTARVFTSIACNCAASFSRTQTRSVPAAASATGPAPTRTVEVTLMRDKSMTETALSWELATNARAWEGATACREQPVAMRTTRSAKRLTGSRLKRISFNSPILPCARETLLDSDGRRVRRHAVHREHHRHRTSALDSRGNRDVHLIQSREAGRKSRVGDCRGNSADGRLHRRRGLDIFRRHQRRHRREGRQRSGGISVAHVLSHRAETRAVDRDALAHSGGLARHAGDAVDGRDECARARVLDCALARAL